MKDSEYFEVHFQTSSGNAGSACITLRKRCRGKQFKFFEYVNSYIYIVSDKTKLLIVTRSAKMSETKTAPTTGSGEFLRCIEIILQRYTEALLYIRSNLQSDGRNNKTSFNSLTARGCHDLFVSKSTIWLLLSFGNMCDCSCRKISHMRRGKRVNRQQKRSTHQRAIHTIRHEEGAARATPSVSAAGALLRHDLIDKSLTCFNGGRVCCRCVSTSPTMNETFI